MGEYHGVVVDVATRAAGFTALGHLMSIMHGRQSRTQVNERALTDALAEQAAKVEAIEDQLANLEVKWAAGELVQRAYDRTKPVLDQRLAAARARLDGLAHPAAPLPADAAADWAEATGPEPTTRRFGSVPQRRPAQSN